MADLELVLWMQLTSTKGIVGLMLVVIWLAPNWGYKVVALAKAVREFRHDTPQANGLAANKPSVDSHRGGC
jgi:hypothetical protein